MGITKSLDAKHLPELRAWMKRTGTTQQDLARLLNVGEAQISRYMNGSRNLSAEPAIKLALLTDIPVEKLLMGGDAARLLKLLGKRRTSTMRKVEDKSNVA
jgi:transcriptional regulator with XRE-family HTH domain